VSSAYLWSPEDDKDKFAGVVLLKKGTADSTAPLRASSSARSRSSSPFFLRSSPSDTTAGSVPDARATSRCYSSRAVH
jgi:hypothetical protein